MSVVRSNTTATSEETLKQEFHPKINAVKDILKLLKTRLCFLEATGSHVQHELLADITKLEHALSFAVRELQRTVMKRQMVELAIERSILSTLLYIPSKKFFNSHNLNDIEQMIANQLETMLSQSKSFQDAIQISHETFDQLNARKIELLTYVHRTIVKLRNESSCEIDEEKYEKNLKAIKTINFCRELISVLIGTHMSKECNSLMPLAMKWRTPRSINYYENKV